MPSENVQNSDRAYRTRENTHQHKVNRLRKLRSLRRLRSMSSKAIKTPLLTASGNLRTRGSGKKSQKAKKNKGQKEKGLTVLKDLSNTDIIIIPETQLEPQPSNKALARIEEKINALTAITALIRAKINKLKSIHRTKVTDLKKIVEQLQIELHELRE